MELRTRFAVDDAELSRLHALAFGSAADVQPWAERLDAYALTWIGAFSNQELVGFVQVCTDGGAHAFLLDTVVHPGHAGRGLGRRLVLTATDEARAAGCTWLHVDFEPQLAPFYVEVCGFRPTAAALLDLRD